MVYDKVFHLFDSRQREGGGTLKRQNIKYLAILPMGVLKSVKKRVYQIIYLIYPLIKLYNQIIITISFLPAQTYF